MRGSAPPQLPGRQLAQVLDRAVSLHRAGQLAEAERLYRQALKERPDEPQVNYLLAVLRHQSGRPRDALKPLAAALKARPDWLEALLLQGMVQHLSERYADALASFDRALTVQPQSIDALNGRANVLHRLARYADAVATYDRVIALRPADAAALYNRANTLHELGRNEEALAGYDSALALAPDDADVLNNRAIVLLAFKRPQEALAAYDKVLTINPGYVVALNNRGNALRELNRPEEALASYDRAVALKPDYSEAFFNRGVALDDLQRYEDSLLSYDRAIALAPTAAANAMYHRGNTLKEIGRFEDAIASYQHALAVDPAHLQAFGGLADAVVKTCDWRRFGEVTRELVTKVADKKVIVSPFTLLGYCSDPATLKTSAETYVHDRFPILPQPLWQGATWRHDKVRVAYLSADFHRHATAYLIAELLELHDRERFEVIGISFGRDDGSAMRKRLVDAFDQFHDVQASSDRAAAALVNELAVEIAVDLKGYTTNARPGILAWRPSPIQVNYLGYPGTTAASFMDYVVADPIILPFDQQPFYTERIVHLPDCYQCNDSKRHIPADAPSRAEAGLPDHGFVFCSFNNSYKITPPVFDVWMRLLAAVDGSVFWLLRDNDAAARNLQMEAARRGVDPARLVFADRLPVEQHLARHRLADLSLDTLPYNAHTTASDALWTGLPVLTCQGEAFAGRVAASVLYAAGLPELVTLNLADYEALALRLATDPALLHGLRERLAQNRLSCPLYDTDRLRRHLEAAYTTMWEIWQRGEAPRSFAVEPMLQPGSISAKSRP